MPAYVKTHTEEKPSNKNMQNIVLINNSKTAWPTKMLTPIFSFSDNFV